MQRRNVINFAVIAVGLVTLTAGLFAQQAPAARPAAAEPALVPPMLWKEVWKQVLSGPVPDHVTRRVVPASVTNPNLELKLYGEHAYAVQVIVNHEGRQDLWTGMSPAPVAMLLRDKRNFVDLTGLARLRAIVRTDSLHVLFPAIKLANGTLAVGSREISTDGDFLMTEVGFVGQIWRRLDPMTVTTSNEASKGSDSIILANPDLSRVDEVGFVELMPGGGAGTPGGWTNVSTVELYAKPVPR